MISDDQIDEYLRNPKKYKKEMKKMTDDMMKMFTDPDAMKGMMDMVQGVGEMLADPEKLEEAIMDIARELEEWETELSGPEKVEAARQQLLSSPDLEDNPVLREVFESKEMRDIIGSKEKWRKVSLGDGGEGRLERSVSNTQYTNLTDNPCHTRFARNPHPNLFSIIISFIVDCHGGEGENQDGRRGGGTLNKGEAGGGKRSG